MRIVFQRVSSASVTVDGQVIASIATGALILVGVAAGDDEAEAVRIARKCVDLRVFPGGEGRFDRSLIDAGGEALAVSQFTLLAEVRKGRRPSFDSAARPDVAEPVMNAFVAALRNAGIPTQTGEFGAHMDVELVNDGPVTIVIDSSDLDRPLG